MDDIRTLGSTTHLVNLTGIKLKRVTRDDEMLKVLCDTTVGNNHWIPFVHILQTKVIQTWERLQLQISPYLKNL